MEAAKFSTIERLRDGRAMEMRALGRTDQVSLMLVCVPLRS
jgi:hypothetical protein